MYRKGIQPETCKSAIDIDIKQNGSRFPKIHLTIFSSIHFTSDPLLPPRGISFYQIQKGYQIQGYLFSCW